MTDVRPELIFVAGPQEGERAVLMRNVAIGGRSTSVDLQLTERFVSREQLQFELTYEGWVVENLTRNPFRVNGKRYKTDKRILLDTGDVIDVGVETRILFVGPGEDPEDALAAYRQEFPVSETAPAVPEQPEAPDQAPPEAQPETPPEARQQGPDQEADQEGEQEEELSEEEVQAALERREKLKKYAVYGGVYLVLLVGGVLLLSRGKTNPPQVAGSLPSLNDRQIEEVLSRRIPGRPPYYAEIADGHLARAMIFRREATMRTGNLYRAVKRFKLYLAFTEKGSFPNARLEEQYEQALEELIRQVKKQYRIAYQFEKNGNFEDALEAFEELRKMVPAKEEPAPEADNMVFDNVVKHITRLRREIRIKKEQRRGGP